MFQRRKGRDLFDLYWALTSRSALPVSIDAVADAFFRHYMREEETDAPRAEFVAFLRRSMAIGLYQVARHADACGYALALAHNADGRVSFVLSGPVKPAAQPPAASRLPVKAVCRKRPCGS